MVVGVLRVEGDLRQQPSLHQIDIVARRLLVEGSGEDVGVDPLGHRKGAVKGFRRQCRKLRKAQGPRRVADDPDVIGDRSGEICLRRGQRRARQRQARLRLRHIGAGDLADIEARLRRLELLGQHLDILLAELQDVAVANDIHIGGGAVEQNLLLDRQQALTTGTDQGFGLRRPADRLEAAENRLRQRDRDACRCCPRRLGDARIIPCHAGIAIGRDRRPPAGERLRHGLVGGALPRPFGVERRTAHIGGRKGGSDQFGARSRRARPGEGDSGKRRGHETAHRRDDRDPHDTPLSNAVGDSRAAARPDATSQLQA